MQYAISCEWIDGQVSYTEKSSGQVGTQLIGSD